MTSQRQHQSNFREIEPQLIAEAIAAFSQNNANRVSAGLPELTSRRIPGIVMSGTAVSFYLIPVTETLEGALLTASYPAQETIVLRFIPPVPDPIRYTMRGYGMGPLENRRIVLQCFEAFRIFVVSDPN